MALKPKKQAKVLKTITRDDGDLIIRLFGKNRKLCLQLKYPGWIDELDAIRDLHNVPDVDFISHISITQAIIKGHPNYNRGQINSFNRKQAKRALFRNLNRYYQFIVEKDRGARLHEFVRPDPEFMEIIEQAKNDPSTEGVIKVSVSGSVNITRYPDKLNEGLRSEEMRNILNGDPIVYNKPVISPEGVVTVNGIDYLNGGFHQSPNPLHPYPNPEDPVNFLYPNPIVALPIPKELGPDVEFDENGNMRNVD